MLFYRPEDLGLRRFFASGGGADPDDVAAVAETVDAFGASDVDRLVEHTGLSKSR